MSFQESWELHSGAQKTAINHLYNQLRVQLLGKKNYQLSPLMLDKISATAAANNLDKDDLSLRILERFNLEEGALPDALGKAYVDLLFSPENMARKIGQGLSFYESIAALDLEARAKGINLDKEELDLCVAALKKSGLYAEPE